MLSRVEHEKCLMILGSLFSVVSQGKLHKKLMLLKFLMWIHCLHSCPLHFVLFCGLKYKTGDNTWGRTYVMITYVSKENNLGPDDKIRYIRGHKGLVRINFLYPYQMLSFYEIKSFTRALRNTLTMRSVFRNALVNRYIS